MTNVSLAGMRRPYDRSPLKRADLAADPIQQFQTWFAEAAESGLIEPNAMTLATADANGRPSARMVLLKGIDARGFVFFTNYESRKGRELAANGWAALVFWWPTLERQVRVEGTVSQIDAVESDAYYQSRPLGSRLGAWASPQSRPVSDRQQLVADAAAALDRHGQNPVRPTNWGGFRVAPDRIEFWQGQPDRLHDRLRYEPDGAGWRLTRLAP